MDNTNNSENNGGNNKNSDSGFLSLFIYRPVLSWVINIIIIVVGFVSWQKLETRDMPKISIPTIQVKAEYSDAGANIVESQIVMPLEEALSGIENLNTMESHSYNTGSAEITLNFKPNTNADVAFANVREKVAGAKGSLPSQNHLRDPIVSKASSEQVTMMGIAAYSDKRSASEVSMWIEANLKTIIEPINGVATAAVSGIISSGGDSGPYRIYAYISPEKLYSANLSYQEIHRIIASQIGRFPLTPINRNDQRITASLDLMPKKVEDYSNLIVKAGENGIVRLKDIANIETSTINTESFFRLNGKDAAYLYVIPQSDANIITISKEIRNKIDDIKKIAPKDIHIEIINDKSKKIEESIREVYKAIFEAILCVFLIMFLFLKSGKSTFIPMTTIPICLLSGFFIMYMFNFSINRLTLLSIVLSVGLVVDDAIVVLENIYRNIENGITPFKAAAIGTEQIKFSIIAMTLTLMAVYIPITLVPGRVGREFTEFAITLAGTVVVSGIVSLILTPMLCARILTHSTTKTKFAEKVDNVLDLIDKKYETIFDVAIKSMKILIIGIITFVALSFGLSYLYINKSLIPVTDDGSIYLQFEGPRKATPEYYSKRAIAIEKALSKIGVIKNYMTNIESKYRGINIYLIDASKRKTNQDIMPDIKKALSKLHAGFSIKYDSSDNKQNTQLIICLQTTKDYEQLEALSHKVTGILRQHPDIDDNAFMFTAIGEEKSYNVTINKEKAHRLNIGIDEITQTLSHLTTGQPPIDRFELDGRRYPVVLVVDDDFKKDPENLKRFYVRQQTNTSERRLISLNEVLNIEETKSRAIHYRYNGQKAMNIYAQLKKGDPISVFRSLEPALSAIMPAGCKYSPSASLLSDLQESQNIKTIFLLAFIFIFLILAAQFESFLDPLIILLSAPLAIGGGLLSLFFIRNSSLNIYVIITLITLIALIAKHGILIVDFANKILEAKEKTTENIIHAIKQASLLRLRPILMTTSAMVLGAVPLMFSKGAEYEIRRQMGSIIVFGMTIGTILSLIFIPCVYILLKKIRYNSK